MQNQSTDQHSPSDFWLARAFSGLMGIGVGLGAFGAHALKESRTPAQLETWKTATLYVLIHALAGAVLSLPTFRMPRASLYMFLFGCIVFGGSLYALVLMQISLLGAITPFGGLMFILGWLNLALRLGR
ncbi:MAG: hypothetical protein RI953_1984 [Pseudomonadota bacterium]|jgi:uncharacterized membrane protein YgdD (TMEM256/DUF423 family)